MTATAILEKIRELDERHRKDGDGGYGLLAEIREYGDQLADDQLLRSVLVRLVEEQDKTLWGVALEALVQDWGRESAQDLTKMLVRQNRNIEWESHVLLALLRLGHEPIMEKSVEHISQRISSGDRTVLPMIAALSRVNPGECIALASTVFLDEFANQNGPKLTGYIPAFVRNFLDVDANLLGKIVWTVSESNELAGRNLATMFVEYFDRPYVQDGLGSKNATLLKASITSAFL